MNAVIVTSSWDDGHKYDVRLARMLREYGLKATFYISPRNQEWAEADLMKNNEIREVGKDFEIGSHTVTHPRLPTIPESRREQRLSTQRQCWRILPASRLRVFAILAAPIHQFTHTL